MLWHLVREEKLEGVDALLDELPHVRSNLSRTEGQNEVGMEEQ
jgi:hypothetical protein